MACGILPRQDGLVSLPVSPFVFPQFRAGDPTGFRHLPAFYNHFVSDCPITDADVTSYADDFSLLA